MPKSEAYGQAESSVDAAKHPNVTNTPRSPAIAEQYHAVTPDKGTNHRSSEASIIHDSMADHDYCLPHTACEDMTSTNSPESVTLNNPSSHPRHADHVHDPAELLPSCNCPQWPLHLERNLSLTDLEKLATREAPSWKTNETRACPVCSINIRTYGIVSTGLRHLWFHAKPELNLRRCPCNECGYTNADRTSLIRHYRRHHGPWTPTVRAASEQTQNIRRYRTLLQKLSGRTSRTRTGLKQNTSTIIAPDDLERYTANSAQLWETNKRLNCPVCRQPLRSRRFCAIVLHLLKLTAPSEHLHHCPFGLCEFTHNISAYVTRLYKRIHGKWTPNIRKLTLNMTNHKQYASLLRLGHRVIMQARTETIRRRNVAADNDLRSAQDNNSEKASDILRPLHQESAHTDEEHLDALEELSLMEDLPPPPSTTTSVQQTPVNTHAPYSTMRTILPTDKTPEPAPSTLQDYADALSRFDPESETFVLFKRYIVFFEAMNATPWWISIDSPLRQRRFREVLQQTERRQKHNLVIVSCDLQQNQCSNLAQILCKHLAVTDLMMPNDPTFLRSPQTRKLRQLVNAFPTTLQKLYNLPYPSMLASEGRQVLGRHEVRTVGYPTSNNVDLLSNFTQSDPGSCRLSVTYQNATHLCRSFLPDADYTDLEVRMSTTYTRATLMHLLRNIEQLVAKIPALCTTTLYIKHEEPCETTITTQLEASVEHFRSHWNELWAWISKSPKPCNISYTYWSPTATPPTHAIEIRGTPLLTPVTPSVYSNATTSAPGRNIISVLDLTAKECSTHTEIPTGSPLERELFSALKNLFDDTFRQHDAVTLQTTIALEAEPTLQATASSEAEPLQLRTTATTPIPKEPPASTSTAKHNTMERRHRTATRASLLRRPGESQHRQTTRSTSTCQNSATICNLV